MSKDKIDQKLWSQIEKVVKAYKGGSFGYIGTIDGCKVWAVDGNEVKIRPDKPSDKAIHMDFVEGGNDLEAAFVKREYGPKTLLVDGRIDRNDWCFILYHEAEERRLMSTGMSYEKAHDCANQCERQLRLEAVKEKK